jgi:hypothetical protein
MAYPRRSFLRRGWRADKDPHQFNLGREEEQNMMFGLLFLDKTRVCVLWTMNDCSVSEVCICVLFSWDESALLVV